MVKYLINRLFRGILSIIATVIIVMVIVYSLIDKQQIVNASDTTYSRLKNNLQTCYKYQKWEDYGYILYENYSDYLIQLKANGEISEEDYENAALGQDTSKSAIDENNYYIAEKDTETCRVYVKQFVEKYQSEGYTIERMPRKNERGKKVLAQGGTPQLVAYKNVPLLTRAWKYFSSILFIDNIYEAEGIADEDRKLEFTWFDPAYGGEKFSPAVMGYGTQHRYLLYVDNEFPYIHQNLVTINLGTSTSLSCGEDVWHYMTKKQGTVISDEIVYFPSGVEEKAADNLHTLTYSEGSFNSDLLNYRFVDDYTVSDPKLKGKSSMAYSFIIGIISTILSYLFGIPLGVLMARKKDTWVDKLGTLYVIFIIAVPSLAYIYMFRAIGGSMGLPTTFFTDEVNAAIHGNKIYILPIVSLALPSVASLMKWIRRYMIDQQNSDYVKFARSEGLSENEIFSKHIAKNALIPIVHGIPGSILGALTGAVITESIYSCPGVGRVLTQSINLTDNAVIVGVTLFYSVLSVLSIILGDVLMALLDPRINYTKGGR